MNKNELRIWAKNKRKNIDMLSTSKILVEKLVKTNQYRQSNNIMLFYPMQDEVDLLQLLDDKSKKFYLPRINGQELECCEYKLGDTLKQSCFKTNEPVCVSCSKQILDMVIVPALACDYSRFRLGYGGGYYDRFLKDFRGIKLCCIPSQLIVKDIFPNKFDIRMDIIIND